MSFFLPIDDYIDKKGILATWEKVSLKDDTFVPKISSSIKTILFQHFFIVFDYCGADSEKIVAFDLKENHWLPAKLSGDKLDLDSRSSICSYGDHAIIIFGSSTDEKESFLDVLSFRKDSNGNRI